jgi:hypothetical protein
MSADPLTSTPSASAERQPAVWPWLLLPLVTLALFFALRAVKDAPSSHSTPSDVAAEPAPGGDSGSR